MTPSNNLERHLHAHEPISATNVVTVSIQLVIHRNLIVQENHLSYIVPMMSIHVMRD